MRAVFGHYGVACGACHTAAARSRPARSAILRRSLPCARPRFGKGTRGRGPKPRLLPAINGADQLIDWWLAEVRHQCGPDWADPDAPLLPSERFDHDLDRCGRVGANALRRTLGIQVDQWLPAWSGQLTPHVLRHYCASSLYEAGMDIKALQELLGHQWLSTTSGYIHVRSEHVELAWRTANQRVEARFTAATD